MSKLRTFINLDRADRLATFEAMASLTLFHLLVRFVPPRHWRRPARIGGRGDHERRQFDVPMTQVLCVRRAVARGRRNLPFEVKCLPQALAARRMLERIGVAGELKMGALVDHGAADRFHAWLRVGDLWVTGDCDEADYAVFDTIDGQPA